MPHLPDIGNAKVAGMATDLKLVGNQYGTCVSGTSHLCSGSDHKLSCLLQWFMLHMLSSSQSVREETRHAFSLSDAFHTDVNLLKILTPRLLLSVSSLVFGILTLSTAWSHKFTGLVAIRVLLGCAEAGIVTGSGISVPASILTSSV